MNYDVYNEFTLLIALAAAIALVMRFLRQPLIIGHILAGILVGPSLLGIVDSPDTIATFGGFGIALLLFIVGLGLNPRVIKEVGRVSLMTGVGQVLFTTLIGFGIARVLGYSAVAGFYIAVALAFSSTIIILKLLTDKREHNKLHGKISIGFLLVQDVIATIALLVASATSTGGVSAQTFAELGLKGILIGIGLYFVTRYVVSPLTNFLSRSQELLFLFALSWGFGVSALFHELGFSLEVGALIAGVALSTMTFAQEIGSKLRPLRDFFIVVFFISLGVGVNLDNIVDVLPQAAGLSAFVLIGNPIIVMTIMGLLGYTKHTSFKSGLAVAQISEFSLIFILLGSRNGQVSDMVVSLVTVVAIMTIAVSSYMITYSDQLYKFLEKYLRLFERRKLKNVREKQASYSAVLVGYSHGASEYIPTLQKLPGKFVVVDYNPDTIDELDSQNIPYLYGDVSESELLSELDFSKTKLVISSTSDHDTNTFLLRHIEEANPKTVVIVSADNVEHAAELYGLGASYVMMPHHVGSEKLSKFLRKNGYKKTEFKKFRERHVQYLQSHYQIDE